MRGVPKIKIIFFLLLFGFSYSGKAFNTPVFKDIKYIYGFENKKICRSFIRNYKKGFFSQKEKSSIVFIISDFNKRDLTSYDAYLDFFSFSNALVENKSDFLNNWLKSLSNCISDFSNTELERVLSSSNNFIKNSILSEHEKFTWSFIGNFDSNSTDTLIFKLNLDSLILSNQFHEIVINNVEGFFDLRRNKFFARNGFVDGKRFGLPFKNIKVNFGEYELDLNKSSIEVSNAILQNNIYFNIETNGHYSDYLSRVPRQGEFPKFQSYKDNLEINFFNGFSCFGAIDIERDNYFFKRFDKLLKFSISNDNLKAVFSSDLLKLKNSSFSSNNVNAKFLFNEGDSLFHPEMKFRYDDLTKDIYLRKYDFSYLGYKPIINSFHGLNIYSDFLRVNLKNSTAAFVHYPSKTDQNVLFESVDYYDEKRYSDLNIDEKNNLLSTLIHFSNKFNFTKRIPVKFFSNKLGLNNTQAINFLSTLEIFDFVSIDYHLNEFDIKNRAFIFFESQKGKFDFDVFQIESSCFFDDTVSKLNFKNLKMDIYNVSNIKITNQHDYYIDLKNKNISFFDDRSFHMSANLSFGKFLFSSKNIEFNYQDFCFNFPNESVCFIELKNDKKNKLTQKLIFQEGKIQIDSINNKSGLVTIYDFPKFHLPNNNYVSFINQDPILVLNKMVIPFLDEIAIQNLSFNGFLKMPNRFKYLEGEVTLDDSSGFNFKGQFESNKLYKDFICSGSFSLNKNKFLISSAEIYNDNFSFNSDSIFINSKFSYSNSVNLKESKYGLKSPNCSFSYNYLDSSMLFSSNNEKFSYHDFIFSGVLNYDFSKKSNNFFGKGVLIAPFFNINSNYFSFTESSFMSGSSAVSIKIDKSNKFLAKGVSVEWSKYSNFLSMIKGDIDFFLPLTQLYLNFDLATLNPYAETINFFNLIETDETKLVLKNFECSVLDFSFNFKSNESKFSWANPFLFNKYIIEPKNQTLEISNYGFLKPFVAKTILKRKLGQNEILKNKLVSFDKEMKTFLLQ